MEVLRDRSCPQDLIEALADELQGPDPDPVRLQGELKSRLALEAEEARRLLYGTVLRVNAALFPPLRQMELLLTERCNLRCTYCFEGGMTERASMSVETGRAAVDLLIDYSGDVKSVKITHFGGEPTLRFAMVREITEYAEQRARKNGKTVRFGMTSNTMCLSEEMVDYFAEHGIRVLVSLDGLGPTHDRFRVDKRGRGTFDRVMRGMNLLKRRQPWIGAKLTVMPETAASLFNNVVGLYELGVNQFLIGAASGVPWSAADAESYFKEWRKIRDWYLQEKRSDLRIGDFEKDHEGRGFFGCQAGRFSIAVGVNGQISGCAKILSLDNRNLVAGLGSVRYGLTHVANRARLIRCDSLRRRCEELDIARRYRGGCFASNYDSGGDIFEPDLQDHVFSTRMADLCQAPA